MSLATVKGTDNIPEGMVQVSREEALNHQKNIVQTWPEFREVFFLRYGRHMAALGSTITSAACLNVFYPLLKFGTGTFTAVLPAILIPPAVIYYKTERVLTDDILTLKKDCPLCHHLKFLALQTYAGLIFPGLWGMLHTAEGHNVHLDPKDTREFWRKTMNIAKSNGAVFRTAFLAQCCLAFFLPYVQHTEVLEILEKLTQKAEEGSDKVSWV